MAELTFVAEVAEMFSSFSFIPACGVFRKKFSRAESCAEAILFLCLEFILLFANKKGRYLRTTLNVYTTE